MNRAGLAYPSGPKNWLEQLASSHQPGTDKSPAGHFAEEYFFENL
jgi:hypothetical protein